MSESDYRAVVAERDELSSNAEEIRLRNEGLTEAIATARDEAADAQADAVTASERATAAEAESDARTKTLDEREVALAARESKVSGAEQTAAANSFGNGTRVIGQGIAAGTYTTTGPTGANPVGCYYAWKSGTGSDAEIVNNNIVQGPATVTLVDGEIFESTSCANWTKAG
ncbi:MULTISPECIES: hypothetical protein [unclassified Rathayibacter]|uniref:hypothetical protein n=1 Tax=unclassified Rathayibacter TaxID=2609250 RepID=UPI000F4C1D46|nr:MULTISPECIES: hypothetical protein [unclassified Rathayibacter]MCJ1705643.1 hypothetical protein [Rathayibacter sp. VKM Ac-2926]